MEEFKEPMDKFFNDAGKRLKIAKNFKSKAENFGLSLSIKNN